MVSRPLKSYHTLLNLRSLKVNFKLGGRNHKVQRINLKDTKTLIIGADVTHPAKGVEPGCPSMAGVVACRGDQPNHYLASARLQKHRTEVMYPLSPC